MLLKVVQDWEQALKGKAQILSDEGGRHGLTQAGQLTDDKVAHLVVCGGHEGVPGVSMPGRLGKMLFPFVTRNRNVLATLTE
jgi:hypothetical protein